MLGGSLTNLKSGGRAHSNKAPDGLQIIQALRFVFKATNNQAEYEALIASLNLARSIQVKYVSIFSDSQIMVRQTADEYATKDLVLTKYQAMVQSLLSSFTNPTLVQVNRKDNTIADLLSKLTETEKENLDGSVYFEELQLPSTDGHQIMEIAGEDATWMTPVIDYLKEGILPDNKIKAKQLQAQYAKYFIQNDTLYKRTFDSPILKCIDPEEALYCMREVHEGICGDHMGGKALAHKILRQGYFWLSLAKDCKAFAKKCSQCQLFSNVPKQAPALPSSILSPIPFAMWGIDIMGPFPKAKNELQYVMVTIDYMTKWAEAKALRNITQRRCYQVRK